MNPLTQRLSGAATFGASSRFSHMVQPLLVGVIPAHEHARRPRLWAALEEAYPVCFEGREAGALGELDALVAIGTAPAFADVSCLLAAGAEETPDATTPVDAGAVACVPAELAEGEALRERLRPGRNKALLALARFLADLTAHLRPAPPPLHAAFVIDDPNLRRRRYGHIDYLELLSNARAHGYHVSIAMVPLDGRLAHRDSAATRIFREGSEHLSLCVHGNDHDGPELGRPTRDEDARVLVAQALRRTAAFERRTGLTVDRVMVPPHERLSEPAARALRACGFDAVCTTRPYPWIADTLECHWLARPPEAGPLAAWHPVDRVASGLPVLLRAEFGHPREDLALRAFLGQPLILYGHHELLAGGPAALAEAAAQINQLGDVRWCSLGEIARALAPGRTAKDMAVHCPAEDVHDPAALDARALGAIPLPPRRLAPIVRRLASEARDRAQALRLTPAPDPTTARGARPTSSSART